MNPYSLALLFSALVSLSVMVFAWQRRPRPGAIAISIFMFGAAIWSLAYALELASTNYETKLFWAKIQYLGIVIVPTMMLIIAIEYRGWGNWLTRRNLSFLALEPLLVLLLVWTNQAHGIIWQAVYLPGPPASALILEYGWGFWVNVIYSYIILLSGSWLLLQTFLQPASLYRAQTGVMLASTLFPWIANALYQLNLNPFPGLDLTPFAFTLTGLGATWGLFRFQLLDITPVAHYAVFENMSDGVIVLDSKSRVVDINSAAHKLFKLPAEQIIGRPAQKVFLDFPELLSTCNSETIKKEICVNNDGLPQKSFDLIISPLYNRRREITGQILVLHDITHRKQMEAELTITRDQALDASRLKSQILANVSHDMRTPLGAVIGYADMLKSGFFGPVNNSQDEKLSIILQSCNQLTDFVDNLLAQSEIASGELHLQKQRISPSALLEEVYSVYTVLAEQKGLLFTTELDPDLPNVLFADRFWLRRILSNLVGNAIKYTEEGGISVRISLANAENWSIQVRDSGIGISDAAQMYIFEPFRKGDEASSRVQQTGAGLGLSIVQEIVTKMNGTIQLKSNIGNGSIFIITLPLLQEITT